MLRDESSLPLHVALSEQCTNSRQQPGVFGRSVRLNGRLHDFSALVPFYGSLFTTKLLDTFTRVFVHATGSTTERRSKNLRRLLVYFAAHSASEKDQGGPVSRVFQALVNNQPEAITREDMSDAVESFIGRLRDLNDFSIVSTGNELTRQNIFESLSPILQDLAAEGLWPDIGPLRGIRGSRSSRGNNIPSLGELRRRKDERTSLKEFNAEYATVVERSRKRLLRLRQLFEDTLLEEEARFQRLQDLLNAPDQPSIDEIRAAVPLIPIDYDRKGRIKAAPVLVQKCFPLLDERTRLGSLLRYIRSDFRGVFRLQQLPYGLQRVVATCGGTANVMSYLEGGPKALLAAYSLLLIDTGYNLQPCDDLAADPFTGRARYGNIRLTRVSSVKNRANYKSVDGWITEEDDDLSSTGEETDRKYIEAPIVVANAKISAGRAIEIWKKLSQPQRDRALRAGNGVADYLWIIRHGHDPLEVRRYDHASWKHWWNEFLSEHINDPVIGGLSITRRMIRTTVIQLRDAFHDSDAEVIALVSGQNRSQVTVRHYLNRTYIRRLLDERIREFQTLFEVSVAGKKVERASQLELSLDEFNERHIRAVETGLGFNCSDPNAGFQSGTEGKLCTRLDACSTCPLLRFVPSIQSVKALVIFHHSLKAAESEFIARNPERWIKVWLPALALCTAIILLLSSGPKQILLRQANSALETGLADQTIVLFQPW